MNFDVQIHDGVRWLSLNDMLNFRVGARSFDSTTVSRNRHAASSPMYDGEWETHSTLNNITETIEVMVHGNDQAGVTSNLDRVIEAFSQRSYQVRKIIGNHAEVWSCFPAEYSIQRGHVYTHAEMAVIILTIPRLPRTTNMVVP